MRRIIQVALATAVLVVAGCATTPAEKGTNSASAPATPTTPDTPPAVPEPEPEPDVPEIALIGPDQWFTYDDGLEVQVTAVTPTTVESNPYIEGWDAGPGVVVTVTIKNGSAAVFDTTAASVLLTYGPNGEQAEDRYDNMFEGSIPPDGSATADYTFGVVPAGSTLLVEVAPSWDHQPTFFEGAL